MNVITHDAKSACEIEAMEKAVEVLRLKRRERGEETLADLGRKAKRLLRDMHIRFDLLDPRNHLFGDPAWAIMLYVFESTSVNKPPSVTDATNGSFAPPTTALRYISALVNAGYLTREPDLRDRRRSLLGLTEKGSTLMTAYLTETG